MDRFTGGFVYNKENWTPLTESDPDVPFNVNDLYPCVIVHSYTCPKCNKSTTSPMWVKNGPHTVLYCPKCKSYIKNANKREKKNLQKASCKIFTLSALLDVLAPSEFVILEYTTENPWVDTYFICHTFVCEMKENPDVIPYLNNTVVGISGMDAITTIVVKK